MQVKESLGGRKRRVKEGERVVEEAAWQRDSMGTPDGWRDGRGELAMEVGERREAKPASDESQRPPQPVQPAR